MTKIGVEENIGAEKNEKIADNIVIEKSEEENEEKTDENDEEVQEILAPSGLANPPYPPTEGDPYAAPTAGAPIYAQPPQYSAPGSLAPSPAPAPQSLAPSPQPVIINIQQNASSQNLAAPAVPQAPILSSDKFGHESQFCKCPFCGHSGMSLMDKKIGNLAWALGCALFWLIPVIVVPCCCVPCCIPQLKDTYHRCAVCQQQLGAKKNC